MPFLSKKDNSQWITPSRSAVVWKEWILVSTSLDIATVRLSALLINCSKLAADIVEPPELFFFLESFFFHLLSLHLSPSLLCALWRRRSSEPKRRRLDRDVIMCFKTFSKKAYSRGQIGQQQSSKRHIQFSWRTLLSFTTLFLFLLHGTTLN